ncbi:NADP-dependent alcohol dehydrogenase [Saitoella complicata NRRL Y-17804]|nr:NADP-dependent alcohol dehydrogenase [Saitoella complicata NRRL Y-17804]ODQ50781.1 NADP-dependent alcohol dehydrogenase [Saitoella complicata NRRL Y-17804]
MASTDYKFQGWVAHDSNSIGNLKHEEYEPKNWSEDDVDIKIQYCGICGSDIHTLRSGWGPTKYPQVVGHEIVGIAVRVGKNVKNVKVGDRIGVGAQSSSCLSCSPCKTHSEPYCEKGMVGTYNGVYPDGSKSTGGYADYARVPSHFCIPIPEGLESEVAAPMMCAGVTVYSPMKDAEVGPGKKVGVIGIGGLGHFGILFAKAMGAEVTAISRSRRKEEDARKMGVTDFIATGEENWQKGHTKEFDVLLCTVSEADMPFGDYLSLLKLRGTFIVVGLPEEGVTLRPGALIRNNAKIVGSLIGSPQTIREMLELAAKSGVKSWVQKYDLENVNQAVKDMEDGKATYRIVLENKKNL